MKRSYRQLFVSLLLVLLLLFAMPLQALAATSAVSAAEGALPPVAATDSAATYTVLMYHHLVPESEIYPGSVNYGNGAVLSVENFEAQMASLASLGANTIFASELYNYLSQGLMPPENTVVIIFDDGYLSNYTYAFPILQRYNIKANISVVVKSSERSAGDGAYLGEIPHFSFDQMKEMASSGLVEFGSHTYDGHGTARTDIYGTEDSVMVNPIYDEETGRLETDYEYRARVKNELELSKYLIEKVTGKPVVYYAYTNGRYNQTILDTLKETGYKLAFTVASRPASASDNIYLLPRINVPNEMTITEFVDAIEGKQG